MTVLSTAALVASPVAVVRDRVRATAVEHVSVAGLLLWWAWPLTRGTGGREPHVLSIGLGLLAIALVATRAWRRVRPVTLLLAAALPAAAFLVCLLAPTGWAGANEAASYAFAAGTFVAVTAYARTPERRRFVLALVAVAGVLEFAEAWLPWWGGENPAAMMWGTFYWHNQFAAFLLPAAVIGVGLAVWSQPPYRVVGWVAAPLCSAGVLFSTSRASLGLLILGWLVVGAALVARPDRRRTLPRFLLAAVAAVAVSFVLTGPPFFAHRAMPNSAVAARDKQQSLEGNGGFRIKTWEEAALVTRAHPITGTGFHGFLAASIKQKPHWPHSAFAHDAWLQATSDGGALLGLPFLAATLALIGGALRRLRHAGVAVAEPIAVVCGVTALGLLLLHSAVDFDTTYPALFALTGIVGAVAARGSDDEPNGASTVVARRSVAAVAVMVALAVVGIQTDWHGGLHLNLGLGPGTASGAAR